MSEQKQALEPIEVEVSTRQERERREQMTNKQIEPGDVIDWRSYARQSMPIRWRT
jgi:hypothetical protein